MSGPPNKAGWLREELDAALADFTASWPEAVMGPIKALDDQVILDALGVLETRTEMLRAEITRRGLVR